MTSPSHLRVFLASIKVWKMTRNSWSPSHWCQIINKMLLFFFFFFQEKTAYFTFLGSGISGSKTATADENSTSKYIPQLICRGKCSLPVELSDSWWKQMGRLFFFLSFFLIKREKNITPWLGRSPKAEVSGCSRRITARMCDWTMGTGPGLVIVIETLLVSS